MKNGHENLKMFFEPRALKLNEILEILDTLIAHFREAYNIQFEAKKLVNAFRNIKDLNRYINLSDAEFSIAMLSLIGVSGKDVSEAVYECFNYTEGSISDIFENGECSTFFIEQMPEADAEYKIVDFTKSTDCNAYSGCRAIAYDFIDKMQQKLWDGILDAYLESYDEPGIYTVQKYDNNFINSLILLPPDGFSTNLSFVKENLTNWAFAHGLIVAEDEVNVIYDKDTNKVILSLDFSL